MNQVEKTTTWERPKAPSKKQQPEEVPSVSRLKDKSGCM